MIGIQIETKDKPLYCLTRKHKENYDYIILNRELNPEHIMHTY